MSVTMLAVIAVVITIVGLGAAIYGLVDAVGEYRFTLDRDVGRARKMYARSTLRSQTFRTIKLTALLGIATMSALDLLPTTRRSINIVLLMTVIVLTSADAVADRMVSHRIVGHIRKRYAQQQKQQQDDPNDGYL